MGGRLHLAVTFWYSEDGTGRGHSPPKPLLAVPNVTAYPSTASILLTVLQYSGPLLCGFNVANKIMFKGKGKSLDTCCQGC